VVVEFGCAALDLSGSFSSVADVYGIDCNPRYESVVRERHPDCNFILGDVGTFTPRKVDIIVLCEILEHLADPMGFTKRMFPMARYAIISHPINEKRKEGYFQHCWAFDEGDFDGWFSANNYRVIRKHEFNNKGSFLIGLGEKIEG
jgi:2-polyprenyl-3-methyl-5-hydroxy-6-metoxy-1,4-benzoquinol methylase